MRGFTIIIEEPPIEGPFVPLRRLDVIEAVSPTFPWWVEDLAFTQCRVRLDIDAAGFPVRVVPRMCDPRFVAPTEAALMQWRFEPVLIRKKHVDVTTEIIVEYTR